MIANIKGLFKMLEEEGVDFFDYSKNELKDHWLCPEDWGKHKKRIMLLKVCSMVGITSGTLDYFYPKKLTCCHNKRCINPSCFFLAKKKKINESLSGCSMSAQDMEELAEEIDMDEWRRLGPKNYLEQFNMQMPPFLRISERTLERVIEWKKGELK